jgi:hypothetical protein
MQIKVTYLANPWAPPKAVSNRRPIRRPNPKWVSNKIPIASNRVPIWKIHFECQERYNLNLNILSPRDPFAERVLF